MMMQQDYSEEFDVNKPPPPKNLSHYPNLWIVAILLVTLFTFGLLFAASRAAQIIRVSGRKIVDVDGNILSTGFVKSELILPPSDIPKLSQKTLKFVTHIETIDNSNRLRIHQIVGAENRAFPSSVLFFTATMEKLQFYSDRAQVWTLSDQTGQIVATQRIQGNPEKNDANQIGLAHTNLTTQQYETCYAHEVCNSFIPGASAGSWAMFAFCCTCQSLSRCQKHVDDVLTQLNCCDMIAIDSLFFETQTVDMDCVQGGLHEAEEEEEVKGGGRINNESSLVNRTTCVDETVCGENGECVILINKTEACLCSDQWSGEFCQGPPPLPVCEGFAMVLDVDRCVCDLGYFFDSNEQGCQPCLPGQYNENLGASECLLCPVGFFQPSWGGMRCFKCWQGTTNLQAGSIQCW